MLVPRDGHSYGDKDFEKEMFWTKLNVSRYSRFNFVAELESYIS